MTRSARRDTRERIVAVAARLTTEIGWSNVTMTKLAGAAGVSRQTVYNEFGSKPQLVQAMIMRELEGFLDLVNASFDENPEDLVAAVQHVVRSVLQRACDSPLLVSVVSATHGADTELLPYLTTQSAWLLDGATAVLRERVTGYEHPLSQAEADVAVDLLLRAVLSHIMQPSGSPESVAQGLGWIVERLLGREVRLPEPVSGAAD